MAHSAAAGRFSKRWLQLKLIVRKNHREENDIHEIIIPTSPMKKREIAGIIINVISQLLIEKQTYQGAQSCHSKWQAKDKGERTKDGLDCETEKERGIRSERPMERLNTKRNEMY